jgi:hypothetical protein
MLRGSKARDGNKPPNVMAPQELNDYYLFLLSEEANKTDNALIFTTDFKEVRKVLSEAPSGKSESWEVFKPYLEENAPKIYSKVRKLGKLVDFLIK